MVGPQQVVRSDLYKLHDPTRGGVGNPLFRKIPVDQAILADEKPRSKSVSPTTLNNVAKRDDFRRSMIALNLAERDEQSPGGGAYRVLGEMVNDWHLRTLEIDFRVAELRYCSERIANGAESRHAPGMKTVGFIQHTTVTKEGPLVTTKEIDPKTGEKLNLWTLEVTFYNLSTAFAGERTFVFGHHEMEERDKWMQLIQSVTEEKNSLDRGMQSYFQLQRKVWSQQMEEWELAKRGEVSNRVNVVAKRKARLLNGKVFNDVDGVFDRAAKQLSAPGEAFHDEWVLTTAEVLDALLELGLELHPTHAARLQDDLDHHPPPGLPPGHVDKTAFKEIFNECYQDITCKPSDQVKTRLMQIMAKSKNPFLQLLTTDEKRQLIEGRDSKTGRPNCNFKTFPKGSILVSQGEEGNSMFIIVDGELSVIVSFGGDGGAPAQRKEVAVLPSGAVMGEMSLVLNKARSATCAVKSASCSVAEITKGAMTELMKTRPHLARELEEMVHRRDTANYLAADSAAAMAAYRKRGAKAKGVAGDGGGADGQGAGRRGGGGESDEEEGQKNLKKKKRMRVKTRLTKKARPSLAANWLDPESAEAQAREDEARLTLPAVKGAVPGAVKTGRWIRCRDGYLLAYD